MDSQTGTASVLKHRRKSHVFVEIPRSPLFKRVASTLEKANGLSASLLHKNFKENSVPLLTKPVVVIEKKRKPIDDYEGMLLPEAKKLKSANGDEGVKACHQCRSKKPLQGIVFNIQHISTQANPFQSCYNARTSPRRQASDAKLPIAIRVSEIGFSLVHLFILHSLDIFPRYGEDIDILRQTKPTSPQHDEIGKDTNYTFK